jgi:hypothetical protein
MSASKWSSSCAPFRKTDRIALDSLGKDLHILLDPGLDQLPDYVGDGAGAGGALADSVAEDCKDFGPGAGMCRRNAAATEALQAGVNQGIYSDITTEALERIIEHLSGVPGRKNLVWLKEHPKCRPASWPCWSRPISRCTRC